MNNIKYATTLLLSFVALCGRLSALEYYAGQHQSQATPEERNLKFTTCTWTHTNEYVAKNAKGRPGSNDLLGVRYDKFNFELDADVAVRDLYLGGDSILKVKKHKLKVKKNMALRIATNRGGNTRFILEDGAFCEMGGSLWYGLFDRSLMAANAVVSLSDSTLILKGALNCMIEAGNTKNPNVAIIGVDMKGKSFLSMNNLMIDPFFKESPSEWLFKWSFSDKGGNLPKVVVEGDSLMHDGQPAMKNCAVEISLKAPKAGEFTLMEFAKRKGGFVKGLWLSINGKKCELGDSVPIGNGSMSAMVVAKGVGKDPQTANDLVLIVK